MNNDYKNKYFELKGGAKEYYIYTTGIAEWGNLDYMFRYWNETLCGIICRCVPETFSVINIIHSDTFVGLEDEHKNETEININKLLCHNYEIDKRIKKIIFQIEPLDFIKIRNSNNSYIIVDLAHIFSYTGINDLHDYQGSTQVYISGHYGEARGETIFLNIFYPGYVGQNQIDPYLYISTRQIFEENPNIINIKDNGSFISFINILSNKSRFVDFDNNYPHDKIFKIIRIIKKIIGQKHKEKYKNYEKFDNEYNNSKNPICMQNYHKILNLTISYIIETDLEENIIIDLISSQVII